MCADKGFAPLYLGHEPIMLLLHQSANFLASEGIEPSHIIVKILRLNHLTIRPLFPYRSPVQVSHLLQLVTKQLHYFYANQAKHIAKKIKKNFLP